MESWLGQQGRTTHEMACSLALAYIFTIILERLDLLISGWTLIFFSFTFREQGECWVDGIGQRTASMTSGPSGTRPCIFLLTINVKLELWEQQAEKGSSRA
ncbi:hypothetical protein V2G26_017804 [Clonostachys chloroleuca]